MERHTARLTLVHSPSFAFIIANLLILLCHQGLSNSVQGSATMPPNDLENFRFGVSAEGIALGIARFDTGNACSVNPVVIVVSILNNSDANVTFSDHLPVETFYRMEVQFEDNRQVPELRYLSSLRHPVESISIRFRAIAPKCDVRQELALSRLYDMSLAGEYRIRISAPHGKNQDGTASWLCSEWLTVRVGR